MFVPKPHSFFSPRPVLPARLYPPPIPPANHARSASPSIHAAAPHLAISPIASPPCLPQAPPPSSRHSSPPRATGLDGVLPVLARPATERGGGILLPPRAAGLEGVKPAAGRLPCGRRQPWWRRRGGPSGAARMLRSPARWTGP
ncbi:hypothetical protein PVAP13_8NG135002 [Panicum virgatum]|uniref:Uncharacterized protein n=1 Tax=Panicum virgatum TaxID=38727 RepID=A0A8T0P7C0_PANVG|nr:hypothetical protein PVAP13_8NG135002 [Panicum virgatum]